MKRFLLVLAIMALMTAVFAQIPPNVTCDGLHPPVPCMPGPVMYAYTVTANNPGEFITDFLVGTDDPNVMNYAGWIVPFADWNVAVIPGPQFLHDGFTLKGFVSPGPMGQCPAFVHFMGGTPVPAGMVATFGFDHPWPAHDVGWMVNTNIGAAYIEFWGAPVGSGAPIPLPSGPVHGPSDVHHEPNPPIDPPPEYGIPGDVTTG